MGHGVALARWAATVDIDGALTAEVPGHVALEICEDRRERFTTLAQVGPRRSVAAHVDREAHQTPKVISGAPPTSAAEPMNLCLSHCFAPLRVSRILGITLAVASQGYHQDVNESASADHATVNWLSAEEVESWLAVVRLMTWLPWSIDQQLRRDSNLAMVEYHVLAILSNSPDRMRRISLLAEWANVSMSHLSPIVNR